MKKRIILLVSLLLSFSMLNCNRDKAPKDFSAENSINVYCSPDLYRVASEWASEFYKINSEVKINVIAGTESTTDKVQNMAGSISFVSGDSEMAMQSESFWKVIIGRDAIVPICNSENPFISKINIQGISPLEFGQIINEPGTENWASLLKDGGDIPVSFFMVDDKSIEAGLSKFLGADLSISEGERVKDGNQLISRVKSDTYSIGICKIAALIDPATQSLPEGIMIIPIDRNGNGKIDYMENIYSDLAVLSRGVQIGKYPRALTTNIYSVTVDKPKGVTEVEFLSWVLTEGQEILFNNGYNDLVINERIAKVAMLEGYTVVETTPKKYAIAGKTFSFYIYFPIILTLVFVLGFAGISAFQYLRDRRQKSLVNIIDPEHLISEIDVKSPSGICYDKTHTWAFMEKDGMVKIGLDDFIQHITGPITRVKMKQPGERVKKGKHILSIIQEGKQLEIYAPVSGIIKEQNEELLTNTSIINSSPYSEGWIYKIEPTNWLQEIRFFIMGENYQEWLKSEFLRLKEFLTDSVRPETLAFARVLQDGGELKHGLLMDFGPEVWEDFQTNFIDVSSR